MFPPSCLANKRRAISAKKRNCTLRLSLIWAENHSRNWAFPNYFLSGPPHSAWAAETSVSVFCNKFHNQLKINDQCSSKPWWTKKRIIKLVGAPNYYGKIVKISGKISHKSRKIQSRNRWGICQKLRFAARWPKILLPHHLFPGWSVFRIIIIISI